MDLMNIGPVFEAAGYAEANRNIVLHLHRLGVNIRVKPRPLGCTQVALDATTRSILENMVHNVRITRATVLYTFLGGFLAPEPGCYSIGLTMLECDRIPQDWAARCNSMDEIWVPSTFNRATFTASGVCPEKIRVMPLGVDECRFHPDNSPLPIRGRRGFAFLSVFEWIPRKGYDVLLRAFLAEFEPHEDVCLILRVHDNSAYDPHGQKIDAEIAVFKSALGKTSGPPIILLPALMTPDDLARLYAAADCFVLPTRGEGWNMTALEAMACGVPTICTNWSAHLDFMTPENSFLIDVERLEPVPAFGIPNDKVYAGANWACPNEAHLRRLMRWAYNNRAQARDTGMKGSRDVIAGFTWEKVARRMYARLAEISSSSSGPDTKGGGGPPRSPQVSGPGGYGPPQGERQSGWVPVTITRTVPPPPPRVREITGDGRYRSEAEAMAEAEAEAALSPLVEPATRACMVVPSWGKRCGIYSYAQALIGELERRGLQVEVAPFGSAAALMSLFQTRTFDIVHFQYEYVLYNINELSSVAGFLRSQGLPAVLTAHDFTAGLVQHNAVVARAFSRVIVHSTQTRAAYVGVGAPAEDVVVIPMGCARYPLQDERDVRARLGLDREPAIGFFGFMLPHKGIIELALAVRDLRMSDPSLKCFMFSSLAPYASSRTYAARVRETFTRLGLWDGVVLNEEYLPEAEAANLLSGMDVNVLPYRDHGFTGTSAAARTVMAAARPMIVTDVPFFSDLGDEVYKIRSATPQELAKAVVTLLADAPLREKLRLCMQATLERLSWSNVAKRHIEVYSEILHKNRRAAPKVRARQDSQDGVALGGDPAWIPEPACQLGFSVRRTGSF